MTRHIPKHARMRRSAKFRIVFVAFTVLLVIMVSFSVWMHFERRAKCNELGGVNETWLYGPDEEIKGTPMNMSVCVDPNTNKRVELDSENIFSYVQSKT